MLVALFVGLGGVAIEFLRRGLNKLFDHFAESSKLAFLARVDDLMMDVVTDIYNSEVEAVKAATADGKLSADEKARFKQIAVDRLKGQLSTDGLGKLVGLFGEAANDALAAKVEKAVTAAKNAGAVKKLDPSKP